MRGRGPALCAAAAAPAAARAAGRERLPAGAAAGAPEHVWVVGGGVVGVTSAYALARRGVPVTLLEAGGGPATACSLVNAGSLRHSPTGLITKPEKLRQLVAAVVRGDGAFRLHPAELLFSLDFWRFAVPYCFATFLASWRRRNEAWFEGNAKWFADVIEDIAAHEGVGDIRRGCLFVTMAPLPPATAYPRESGSCRELAPAEAVALEPSLSPIAEHISGALHCPEDRYAHCGDFVRGLAGVLQQKYGARCRFNAQVDRLLAEDGQVRGLVMADGEVISVGDREAVLLCTGATTPYLLEPLGVRAPIFPMKGYSITAQVPEAQAAQAPNHLLVFEPLHTYVSPYSGGRVRFTSIAEFGGHYSFWDASAIPGDHGERGLQAVRHAARACYPALAPLLEGSGAAAALGAGAPALALCGARPQSADDLPLVGRAPRHANLHVNAGHGQYGWKLSAGCAEIAACLLLGLDPERGDVACLDPARFDAFQAPWRRWGWGFLGHGPMARREGAAQEPSAL